MVVRLAIAGASGRMGRMLVKAALETEGCALTAAMVRSGSEWEGRDAASLIGLPPSGIPITSNDRTALEACDALIDFTRPETMVRLAALAAERGCVFVTGTTGFSPEQDAALNEAATRTVVIQSGNMSLGVNVLAHLVRQAAQALPASFDLEIIEMHHRHKVDAPSGTALLLGEAAAQGRNVSLTTHSITAREGHTGPRPEGAIGFAVVRGGSIVGDHSVLLAGPSERVTLTHHAEDRSIFAQGAVQAARWGQGKQSGRYSMADVLGLNEQKGI